MCMAAGPSSLAEIPEALFAPLRSGGLCRAAPAEPQSSGRLLAARDRAAGEPAPDRDKAEIKALMSVHGVALSPHDSRVPRVRNIRGPGSPLVDSLLTCTGEVHEGFLMLAKARIEK